MILITLQPLGQSGDAIVARKPREFETRAKFHGSASIIKTRRDTGYATAELRNEGSAAGAEGGGKDLP